MAEQRKDAQQVMGGGVADSRGWGGREIKASIKILSHSNQSTSSISVFNLFIRKDLIANNFLKVPYVNAIALRFFSNT